MSDAPIACRLTPDELRCASADLLPRLARHTAARESSGDRTVLAFDPSPDLLAYLARVLDAERVCCPFLHFQLDLPPTPAQLRLTISGPEGTGAFLETLDSAFRPPLANER